MEKQNKSVRLVTQVKRCLRKQNQDVGMRSKDKGCLISRGRTVCSSREKTPSELGERLGSVL